MDQCPSSKKAGKPADLPAEALQQSAGRVYWRSLDEAVGTKEFRDFLQREFPAHASELLDGTRRQFLKIMGASLALAGAATLPGCRRPDHKILPYNKKPEDIIPGKPLFYATAVPLPGGMGAQGMLAETFEGRPTKLEGNPLHPINRGKSDSMSQAVLLGLYDPDRDPMALREGDSGIDAATWAEFETICERDISSYDDTRGRGLAFLVDKSSSPTREAMREAILARWPEASWGVWEPADADGALAGSEMAFGAPMGVTPRFDKASRILSLDCDFLGTESTLPGHRGFASKRLTPGSRAGHAASDSDMNRLYAVESRTTLTGGASDHRLSVRPTRVGLIALAVLDALSHELGSRVPSDARSALGGIGGALSSAGLSESEKTYAKEAAHDLASHASGALVIAGETQPAEVHAAAHAINAMLNGGANVELRPVEGDGARSSAADIDSLADAMGAGSISTLITIGTNPVYDAPAGLDFATKYEGVSRRIHFGAPDETAAMATHYLGRSHVLEQWSDVRAADGTVSIVQPMIMPLFETKGDLDFLAMVVGDTSRDAFELVRETMRKLLRVSGPEFEKRWRRALHDGVVAGTAVAPASGRMRYRALGSSVASMAHAASGASGIDVVFAPCSKVHDGRFANNGWLQELPDAVTKVAWDNPALISKHTADELGIETDRHADGYEYSRGKNVTVTIDGRSIEISVWVTPGMPDNTVVLTMGYGRAAGGRVAQGTGVSVFPVRADGASRIASGASVQKASGSTLLACTQDHWAMEGRAIIREVDLPAWQKYGDIDISEDADIQRDPYDRSRHLTFAGRLGIESHAPANINIHTDDQQKAWGSSRKLTTSYLELDENGEPKLDEQGRPIAMSNKYGKRYQQWGMSIDLNTCTGCGSCTVACQAENNIPVVGKMEVAKGREMSWIRVDRYFSNDRTEYGPTKMGGRAPASMWESPQMTTMPVACVHCESAPCEVVCPVNATVHSESGTNDMAYNRCIGTRYCANNCPYKVRRFNLFDYATKQYKGGFGQQAYWVPDEIAPPNENFIPPRFREPLDEVSQMKHNPHVTVRSRGVMEKCTYCVQRINQAKVETKLEDMDFVPDGFFQTACQQACPSDSIVFGDIYDYQSNGGAGSLVHQKRTDARSYALLAYLNTRPRTTYMIKLRNPNPALREPVVEPFHHGDHHDDHHGEEHHNDHGDDHSSGHGEHAAAERGSLMSLPVLSNFTSGALLS